MGRDVCRLLFLSFSVPSFKNDYENTLPLATPVFYLLPGSGRTSLFETESVNEVSSPPLPSLFFAFEATNNKEKRISQKIAKHVERSTPVVGVLKKVDTIAAVLYEPRTNKTKT